MSTAPRPSGRAVARAGQRPSPRPSGQGRQNAPGARSSRPADLEVLPTSPAGRGVRVAAVLGMILAFAVVFGLVAFHAVIAGQQDQLDAARGELTEAQQRNDELRLDAAELRAPERILERAQDGLGMVPAPEIIYLQPILESDLDATTE